MSAYDLEYVTETDAYLGFIVAERDWTVLNVAAKMFIEHLAKDLPVLVDIITVSVIESDRAEPSAQSGLIQPRCG